MPSSDLEFNAQEKDPAEARALDWSAGGVDQTASAAQPFPPGICMALSL